MYFLVIFSTNDFHLSSSLYFLWDNMCRPSLMKKYFLEMCSILHLCLDTNHSKLVAIIIQIKSPLVDTKISMCVNVVIEFDFNSFTNNQCGTQYVWWDQGQFHLMIINQWCNSTRDHTFITSAKDCVVGLRKWIFFSDVQFYICWRDIGWVGGWMGR